MQAQAANPRTQRYVEQFPMLASILRDADHIDVKTTEARLTLRQFVAGMLAYQPGWVTFLYRVRAVFVRLLGMKQEGVPQAVRIDPNTLPMTPGSKIGFFNVTHAEDERYIAMSASDKHLTAYLAVVAEALGDGRQRFHVITIVHYHHWTGPVYFNAIRPFHHIVVGSMIRAGSRA